MNKDHCVRIHIQNVAAWTEPYQVTKTKWHAAVSRAASDHLDHRVTIANTPDEFAVAMREAEFLLIPIPLVRHLFPVHAPRLRAIMCPNAGLDALAPFDWLPDNVDLLTNSGVHSEKAGEYALMAFLMIVNKIPQAITSQRTAVWSREAGTVLRGKQLTVVGLGGLGSPAAKHAKSFGMNVTGVRIQDKSHESCNRVVTFDRLDEVLPMTDLLLLTCPLNDATRNLMDRRRFSLLPRGVGIINMGRGSLIDEEALCDALDEGGVDAAILDVFVEEPLPAGHRLWKTRNVVITPHMSADDVEAYTPRTLDVMLENIEALRSGRPLPNRFIVGRGY